jgi:predicted RNA-binding Zn ribbon-like protein
MDERDKRRVGEKIEPGGRPKAPGRLELLQRFVNTWNHEFPPEWDRLGTGERASIWLAKTRLLPSGRRISGADAARLRTFREAIRELTSSEQAIPDPGAVRTVSEAAVSAPLHVLIDRAGRTSLEPLGGGIHAVVASLLDILHEAQTAATWPRFKTCRQCGYAFYDRSKNRSAAWCSMSICGNRAKNRTYRKRRSGRFEAIVFAAETPTRSGPARARRRSRPRIGLAR